MSCEIPAVYEEEIRRARTPKTCCVCDWPIVPRARYWSHRGIWDGAWDSYNAHLECRALLEFLREIDYPEMVPFDAWQWVYDSGQMPAYDVVSRCWLLLDPAA